MRWLNSLKIKRIFVWFSSELGGVFQGFFEFGEKTSSRGLSNGNSDEWTWV